MTAASAPVDEDWGRLRAQLRRMLGSRVGSPGDTEDVVQEVLLRVLRGADGLRDADRFGGWLTVTARNALADHLRARRRNPLPRNEPGDQGDEGTVPVDAEGDPDARGLLMLALRPFAERLPAIYREVIILSELEGVPHAEIARRLAISVSGVKSRVQRGREQLRRMLTDCCEIELDARNTVVACVPKRAPSPIDCCAPAPVAPRGTSPARG